MKTNKLNCKKVKGRGISSGRTETTLAMIADAKKGMFPSQIREKYKVTRQHVHQVCKDYLRSEWENPLCAARVAKNKTKNKNRSIVLKHYKKGMTVKDVIKKTGLSRSCITLRCPELVFRKGYPTKYVEKIPKIRKEFSKGRSIKEISEKYKVSYQTCCQYVKDLRQDSLKDSKILAYYHQQKKTGVSTCTIIKKLNISLSTLRNTLRASRLSKEFPVKMKVNQ